MTTAVLLVLIGIWVTVALGLVAIVLAILHVSSYLEDGVRVMRNIELHASRAIQTIAARTK